MDCMKRFLQRSASHPAARFLCVALAVAACAPVQSHAAEAGVASESFSAPARESAEMAWWREASKTRDDRLQWWREARFGMFVHWGVYSGLGNQFQGRKGG